MEKKPEPPFYCSGFVAGTASVTALEPKPQPKTVLQQYLPPIKLHQADDQDNSSSR